MARSSSWRETSIHYALHTTMCSVYTLSGSNVWGIKSIKVSLVMESSGQVADEVTTAPAGPGLYTNQPAVDTTATNFPTKFVRAFWERTVFPQNL